MLAVPAPPLSHQLALDEGNYREASHIKKCSMVSVLSLSFDEH